MGRLWSHVRLTSQFYLLDRFLALLNSSSLPVVEHHAGPKSLLGAAIKAGYMSHYVRTNSLGFPAKSYNTTDESMRRRHLAID